MRFVLTDSIVASVVHAGLYSPIDTSAYQAKLLQTSEHAMFNDDTTASGPDHDLHVQLLILPTLTAYAGSLQFNMKSRSFTGMHQGILVP